MEPHAHCNNIDTSPVCANLSKQLGDHNGLKYQLTVLQVINEEFDGSDFEIRGGGGCLVKSLLRTM